MLAVAINIAAFCPFLISIYHSYLCLEWVWYLSLNKIWRDLSLSPGFRWDRVNYPFSSWWSVKEITTVSGNCLGKDIETARRGAPFPPHSQAAGAGCLLPLVDGKHEWDWAQLVAEWGYPATPWEVDFTSLCKHPSIHTQPAPSDASVGIDRLRDRVGGKQGV